MPKKFFITTQHHFKGFQNSKVIKIKHKKMHQYFYNIIDNQIYLPSSFPGKPKLPPSTDTIERNVNKKTKNIFMISILMVITTFYSYYLYFKYGFAIHLSRNKNHIKFAM